MDPAAERPDPIPPIPGFPFLYVGMAAVIVGPTGQGRSSLVQAGAYDAARRGLRVAYLGSEVTEHEFNARAADLAMRRGDTITEALRGDLARVRYFDLAATLTAAWRHPDEWTREAAAHFDVLAIDPLAAAASALDLDFDTSNADFSRFYDSLVQPLAAADTAVLMLDNIGHAPEARKRAKGASAKADRPDLTFHCAVHARPHGLAVQAGKVRSIRAAHDRGDRWLFDRDARRIEPIAPGALAGTGGDTGTDGDGGAFRPTFLMEQISRAVESEPGLTKRAVRDATKGRNKWKDLALDLLIAEGHVEVREDGQALRCYPVAQYREAGDDRAQAAPEDRGTVPPCPDRAPAQKHPTVPTVPPRAPGVPRPCPDPRMRTVPTVPPPPKGGARARHTGHTPPPHDLPLDDLSGQGRPAVPWHTPPPAPEQPATPAEEAEIARLIPDPAEAAR